MSDAAERLAKALRDLKEARQQLGGISPTTFYALVKDGELSLVKISRRSFVHAEHLGDFLRRKLCRTSRRTGVAHDLGPPANGCPE